MADYDPGALRCVECGTPLVQSVTPDDVVTLRGQRIRFRRVTDFVVCRRCSSLYRVEDIRAGRAFPVGEEELIRLGEATVESEPERG
ncbi:MAG: hypothetical protein ACRDH8_01485 [Actinomycetota bacterium]